MIPWIPFFGLLVVVALQFDYWRRLSAAHKRLGRGAFSLYLQAIQRSALVIGGIQLMYFLGRMAQDTGLGFEWAFDGITFILVVALFFIAFSLLKARGDMEKYYYKREGKKVVLIEK